MSVLVPSWLLGNSKKNPQPNLNCFAFLRTLFHWWLIVCWLTILANKSTCEQGIAEPCWSLPPEVAREHSILWVLKWMVAARGKVNSCNAKLLALGQMCIIRGCDFFESCYCWSLKEACWRVPSSNELPRRLASPITASRRVALHIGLFKRHCGLRRKI